MPASGRRREEDEEEDMEELEAHHHHRLRVIEPDDDGGGAAATCSGDQQQPQARRRQDGDARPIALFYFFYFSSLATFVPFVSLYLRDSAPARLTAAQVGAVASLRPFVSAPAGVLLSALADRRAWHLRLLVAGHALCALARALLVPLSGSLAGVVLATVASEALGAPVCVIADAAAVAEAGALGYGSLRLWGAVGWGGTSLLSGALLHRGGMGASTAAYLLLALPALWAAARVPCGKICRGAAVGGVGAVAAEEAENPGRAGAAAKAEGATTTREEEELCSEAAAPAAAAAARATAAPTTPLPPPPPPPPQAPPTSVAQLLRRDPGVALFLATACLYGVGVGAIGEFLFLHLRDALGAPEWVMGASLAVTCAAEVPAFRMQPRLLRALGVRGAMRLVALAYVARTALYAALPRAAQALLGGGAGGAIGGGGGREVSTLPFLSRLLPPPYVLVLPVEVLHGLCFAVAWATGTAHARRAAPAGCEAELQGWFSGCFFGLGQGVGCLVAGALYSRLGGGEEMFAAVSVGLGAGFVALEVLGMWWPWGGVGEDEQEEEGAWLRGLTERARRWVGGERQRQPQPQQQQQQRYRKLEHKNSAAELALVTTTTTREEEERVVGGGGRRGGGR